jgi:hypothetical protein
MSFRTNTSFSRQLAEFAERAKAAPELVVRKAATDLLTRIVMRTPVGNPSLWKGAPPAGYVGGRARASWGVGLNQVDAAVSVSVTDKDGQTTILHGVSKIANYKAGDSIFIISRLPYITALEYGHSRVQAPQGMVRVSVTEWHDFVRRAAMEVAD